MSQFFINENVVSSERYDMAKFLDFENSEYDLLTSKFLSDLHNLPIGGVYSITTQENRPDRVSYIIYGTEQYWWILLEYNNLLSFEDIVSGLTINFPALTDLETLYFNLKSLQSAEGN